MLQLANECVAIENIKQLSRVFSAGDYAPLPYRLLHRRLSGAQQRGGYAQDVL